MNVVTKIRSISRRRMLQRSHRPAAARRDVQQQWDRLRRPAARNPHALRAVVQRQRHHRKILDSRRHRAGLRALALPRAARSSQASPARHHRARQSRRPAPRSRQRPSPLHERPHDRHAVHRTRRRRTLHIDQVIAGKLAATPASAPSRLASPRSPSAKAFSAT